MQARASRIRPVLSVVLASWLVATATEARAEQISLEAAARVAGLPIETGTATVNGAMIYYRDIGPRTEPIILLHGFPGTGDTFASAAGSVGKRYRAIVPDLARAGLVT